MTPSMRAGALAAIAVQAAACAGGGSGTAPVIPEPGGGGAGAVVWPAPGSAAGRGAGVVPCGILGSGFRNLFAVSPDGAMVAMIASSGVVELRRGDDGSLVRRVALDPGPHDAWAMRFLDGGRLLGVGFHGSPGGWHLLGVDSGKPLPMVSGRAATVPGGPLAVSRTAEGLEARWLRDGAVVWTLREPRLVGELIPLFVAGGKLVQAESDGLALLARASDGAPLWELAEPRVRDRRIEVSPDGRQVAVQIGRGRGAALSVYEVGTGRLLWRRVGRDAGSLEDAGFVGAGLIAGASRVWVWLWDTETGRVTDALPMLPSEEVDGLAVAGHTSQGRLVVLHEHEGDSLNAVHAVDFQRRTAQRFERGAVSAIVDGRFLVWHGGGNHLWSPEDDFPGRPLGVEGRAMDEGGRLLVGFRIADIGGTVRAVDLGEGQLRWSVPPPPGPTSQVRRVVAQPGQPVLATADDRDFHLWRFGDEGVSMQGPLPIGGAPGFVMLRGGLRRVAQAGALGPAAGETLLVVAEQADREPPGRTLVRALRVDSGAAAWTLGPVEPPIALSPEGTWLAVRAGRRMRLHATADGRLAAETPDIDFGAWPDAAFSGDGRRLVVSLLGPADPGLRLFDTATGASVAAVARPLNGGPNNTRVAVSPDGRFAAEVKSGLTVYDLEEARVIFQQADGLVARMSTLAFVPGRRLLAAGGTDGLVRVYCY